VEKCLFRQSLEAIWERIETGDIDMFSQGTKVFFQGEVGTDGIRVWTAVSKEKNTFRFGNDVGERSEFFVKTLHNRV
jgi:hypothetical protein